MLPARAEAVVDLDAIRSSVATLTRTAGGAAVMAVVKADGYGHGMVPAARAALDGGASWLGVALVEEAVALREAGITARTLVLMEPPPGAAGLAREHGVDLVASTPAGLHDGVRLHLEVDTGLSRGGATAAEWPALVEAARGKDVAGIWSHFAHADAPGHPTTAAQLARFAEALEIAERAGLRPEVRHVANSAGTLTLPGARYDLVRPGLAVYGLSPVPGEDFGLEPAMTLRARVALTKRVPAGTGVSYGHRYTTDRETTLALVPLGYADGVPRHATNTAEVLLAGKRRRIAGTVCMDQFVLDAGDDEVEAGDEVVLFGPGHGGEPTAEDWARALGTISYEVVTRIGARVPRRYVHAPQDAARAAAGASP